MPEFEMDHVILVVDDLETAVGEFTDAGFHVSPGGDFPPDVPLHNALIALSENTYIELLAMRKTSTRAIMRGLYRIGLLRGLLRRKPFGMQRIGGLLGEPRGIRDFALYSTTLDTSTAPFQAFGRWEQSDAERRTPDGETAKWTMAFPEDRLLPFLISDSTRRDIRVPSFKPHLNGTKRIEEIRLKDAALSSLHQLLDGSANAIVKNETITRFPPTTRLTGNHTGLLEITLGPAPAPQYRDAIARLQRRYSGIQFM